MFSDKLNVLQLTYVECIGYLNDLKAELKLNGPVVKTNTGKVGYLTVDTDIKYPLIFRIEYSNVDAKGHISTRPCWSLNVNGLSDDEIKAKLTNNFIPATKDDLRKYKIKY